MRTLTALLPLLLAATSAAASPPGTDLRTEDTFPLLLTLTLEPGEPREGWLDRGAPEARVAHLDVNPIVTVRSVRRRYREVAPRTLVRGPAPASRVELVLAGGVRQLHRTVHPSSVHSPTGRVTLRFCVPMSPAVRALEVVHDGRTVERLERRAVPPRVRGLLIEDDVAVQSLWSEVARLQARGHVRRGTPAGRRWTQLMTKTPARGWRDHGPLPEHGAFRWNDGLAALDSVYAELTVTDGFTCHVARWVGPPARRGR